MGLNDFFFSNNMEMIIKKKQKHAHYFYTAIGNGGYNKKKFCNPSFVYCSSLILIIFHICQVKMHEISLHAYPYQDAFIVMSSTSAACGLQVRVHYVLHL